MDKVWFFKYNGIIYCKIGRLTSYFTPVYVKRNQRRLTLKDKHLIFDRKGFTYLFNYI